MFCYGKTKINRTARKLNPFNCPSTGAKGTIFKYFRMLIHLFLCSLRMMLLLKALYLRNPK